ncbi:AmiS/UreI family transporter [Solibacillus silvestris]
MLLNLVESKSATVINFLVGLLQIVFPTYLIIIFSVDLLTILNVAVTNWKGLSTTGVGYYCIWVV